MGNISPAALTLARESRRMTQTALAQALGVKQSTISKLENGMGVVTDEQVEQLASVLDYPAGFFSLDVQIQDLPVVFYRKKADVGALHERAIRAQVNILRLRLMKLLKSVDVPECRVPLVRLDQTSRTPADVARELRAHWGVPRGPVENVVDLLERAGVVVVRCDFGVDSVDGISLHRAEDGAPPMVFVNSRFPGDRMRFTLAHELAHVIFHHHQPLPSEDCEDEANDFAAEFLAPAMEIRPHLARLTFEGLASLKRHWRVSMMFLLKRAHKLGRLTDWKARQMWIQAGQLGYRKKEPIDIPPEEPSYLKEVLRVHLEELDYSAEELAELLVDNVDNVTSMRAGTPRLRAVK